MKPPCVLQPLQPGDLVALVAPAGPVSPERARGAVEVLENRGLRVHAREDLSSRHRYLAGPDGRRIDELLAALLDPAVKAVFLARGGYGGQRLLGSLGVLQFAPPKPVIGFSDNTALLHFLRHRFGWPSLHGPHPQRERPEELDAVLRCLGHRGPPERPAFQGLRRLNEGFGETVEGEVAGGCLSLVSSSIGTPYQFSFRGRIVFLEDTGEPAYRLDRMLHQLCASGVLDGALAVLFGQPESFVPPGAGLEAEYLEGLLNEFASDAPFPVLCGLPCGHTQPNRPLPLGPRARLEPEEGTLEFLEGLVEDEV